MRLHLLSVVALAAALAVPAGATTDTSSLSAFVRSCATDSKGCHSVVVSAVITARSANYGCIAPELSNDDAANKLSDWLKDTAAGDPKYAKEALADLMWTGIDEIWPCKK